MKRLIVPVLLLPLALIGQVAAGQEPSNLLRRDRQELEFLSPERTTPEMWFYLQEMRRYDDPSQAVRRKAEARAEARQRRIASLKWYGYSNTRPVVNSTPWGSTYSPHWVSNTSHPWAWTAGRQSVLLLSPGGTYTR